MNLKFALRQGIKMLLQNAVLPCAYGFWSAVYAGREKDLIIFADAHHDTLPFSMEAIHSRLTEKGYSISVELCNFAKVSQLASLRFSLKFMRSYARAKYVFICDNFLPVSACRKSHKTTVIQLWHGCGLMKKMGYDTTEDIPAGYRGEVYRNYDLLPVSSPACVEPLSRAMHQKDGVLQPLGVSRTDVFFDEAWRQRCRQEFFAAHPQAVGKTVILWAPTFRGSAGDPRQVGMEAIAALEKQLGDGYYLLRKVHPHVDDRYHLSNCAIPTERLLCVADLLITDYSTVLIEYLFLGKSVVLFAPDKEEYLQKRGFYVPYESLCPYLVTEETELQAAVLEALRDPKLDALEKTRLLHASACDGNSTERILQYLEL